VRGLAFNQSGTRLVSCDDDAMIIKWDVSDQKAITKISSLKNGQTWLLSVSSWQDDRIFGVSDLDGGIRIIWTGGTYSANVKVPVRKIVFRPSVSADIQVAVATRGKGCMFMTGSAFKLNERKKVSYFPFLD
jgi:WD40 repeat protein